MLDREVAAKIKAKLAEIVDLVDGHTGPYSGKEPAAPIVVQRPVTPLGNPYGTPQSVTSNPYVAPAKAEEPPPWPVTQPTVSKGSRVLAHARKHTGKPYQWGGTGNPSFDCSGLTQWSYRQEGIEIGRTTFDQIKNGREIPFEEAQDGDLIFSRFSDRGPEHVSINIAGPDKVFEAGDPIGEYAWGDRGTVIVKRYV